MKTKYKWEFKKLNNAYCVGIDLVIIDNEVKAGLVMAEELDLEDAKYICKAVNSHEKLVEALKESIEK